MVVEIIFNLFERWQQEERQMFGCYSYERVEVRYKIESVILFVFFGFLWDPIKFVSIPLRKPNF